MPAASVRSTSTRPPNLSAMSRTRERPNPKPRRLASPLEKRSNIWSGAVPTMPPPWSLTRISTCGPTCRAVTWTVESAGECPSALSRRMTRARTRAVGVAKAKTPSSTWTATLTLSTWLTPAVRRAASDAAAETSTATAFSGPTLVASATRSRSLRICSSASASRRSSLSAPSTSPPRSNRCCAS